MLRDLSSTAIASRGTPRSTRSGTAAARSLEPDTTTTGALPAFQMRAACHTLSAASFMSGCSIVSTFPMPPPRTTAASAAGSESTDCEARYGLSSGSPSRNMQAGVAWNQRTASERPSIQAPSLRRLENMAAPTHAQTNGSVSGLKKNQTILFRRYICRQTRPA